MVINTRCLPTYNTTLRKSGSHHQVELFDLGEKFWFLPKPRIRIFWKTNLYYKRKFEIHLFRNSKNCRCTTWCITRQTKTTINKRGNVADIFLHFKREWLLKNQGRFLTDKRIVCVTSHSRIHKLNVLIKKSAKGGW